MAKTGKKGPIVDFETTMSELESLLEKMEQGEFSLEDSIKQFERGMTLARMCQKALRVAEQKVLKLTEDGSKETLEEFKPPDQD